MAIARGSLRTRTLVPSVYSCHQQLVVHALVRNYPLTIRPEVAEIHRTFFRMGRDPFN